MVSFYNFYDDGTIVYGEANSASIWNISDEKIKIISGGVEDVPYIIAVIAHDIDMEDMDGAECFVYRVYAISEESAQQKFLDDPEIITYLQGRSPKDIYDIDIWDALYIYMEFDPKLTCLKPDSAVRVVS